MNLSPIPEIGMQTCLYQEQAQAWPASGRHIMAQYDADTVYVYQAYRPSIARYAVDHQRFGGDFSFTRMSWIKPNFLWMMFRAGRAAKEGQEHILAVRLKRTFFDELLLAAVASTYQPDRFATHKEWKTAVETSDVRLQWDPDHDPEGRPIERRAVQLGLRGQMLRRYGQKDLISIEDITPFVVEQRQNLHDQTQLWTPAEHVYQPSSRNTACAIGLDVWPSTIIPQ